MAFGQGGYVLFRGGRLTGVKYIDLDGAQGSDLGWWRVGLL